MTFLEGTEPETGDGKVTVVLSEKCDDVLGKLENIKRWRVQPTMVRGSMKTPADMGSSSLAAKLGKMHHSAKKPAKKVQQKALKKPTTTSKTKKKSSHNVAEIKSADELTAQDFGRDATGEESIRLFVQHLYDTDLEMNPKAKVFDAEGQCRLKFDGASKFKWPALRDCAPRALEAMQLV